MKNKFIILYTTFASLIFAFSIVFLSVNLYKEYSYGQARTSAVFNSITTEIRNKSKTQNPNEIIKNLNKSFDKYNDFAFIKITYDSKELLKYPSNINEYNPSNSKLTKKFKSSITSSVDNSTYYIECDLYLLRPYSIFYYSKISFLIILIITIITIIIIIYVNMSFETSSSSKKIELSESNTENHQENIIESTVINNHELALSEATSEPVLSNDSNISETKSEPDAVVTEINTESNDESQVSVDASQTPEKVSLPSEEIKPSVIENKINIDTNDSDINNSKPEGLFNPVTGFGWEQYLLTRLDSEINRAISSEIDLSLFIFQLPEFSKDSELLKNVCNYLAIQFQFKDLLFEFKDNCLVAMKISMDIDEALNFADKLFSDIKNILLDKELYIGISTRSIRMVSGERLLHEAEEALKHSHDNKDSPIIAFRVDAEKYRQFLEQNN